MAPAPDPRTTTTAPDPINPFQPPEAPVGPVDVPPADGYDPIAVRQANLPHERDIRSVGRLLGLVAALLTVGFGLMNLAISGWVSLAIHPREAWTLGVFCLVAAPPLALLGWGLGRLWNPVRWVTIGLLVLLMFESGSRLVLGIYFPFEFALGGGAARASLVARVLVWVYLLSLLVRPSHGRVCGRAYRAVVRATPAVRCPTRQGALVLMTIAGGVLGYAVVALLTGPPVDLPPPPVPPVPPPGA